MATDPQQILAQQVPTGQQPTATQVPISQASQALPVTQFPGVGINAASPTPTPTLSSQSVPQTSQPTAGPLGDLPLLQPYTSSLPYIAALEQQPVLQLPTYSDPVLSDIQAKLIAQQQANPLLNGQGQASPASKLAKVQAPMSVGQMLSTAGQQLWNQEVVNPIQDYINTWKSNPEQALLETLGGVAVTAGLVGLEAITGGAATPFIFAGLAAMQAPNLINSWSQEVLHPSDANMVQAMVSTGAAAIAVGSPVRAFKGVGVARNLLEAQVLARREGITADQVAGLLLGTRDTNRLNLRTGAPLAQQLATLSINDVDGLRAQLERRNANLDKGPAASLLAHSEAIGQIRNDLQAARAAGDDETALHKVAEIKQYVADNLHEPFFQTAYEYTFLPTTPYSHVPLGAIQGVSEAVQSSLDQHYKAIYGLLRRMHQGFGLQGVSDAATTDIAHIKEAEAVDRAAGSPHDTANRILTHLQAMQKAAGISDEVSIPITRADGTKEALGLHEAVNQALEEPEVWNALWSGHQAYAQKLRNLADVVTVGDLKFGTVAQAVQGQLWHYFTGVAGETDKAQEELEAAAKRVYTSSWLAHPQGSRKDFWRAAVNDEGNVEFRGKTRSQIINDTREQARAYETTHEHRQLYEQNTKQVQSWRRALGQYRRNKNDDGEVRLLARVERILGKKAVDLVQATDSELDKIRNAKPVAQELVTGEEAVKRMLTSHVFRTQQAMYGEALQAHANLNLANIKSFFGKLPMKHWGAKMALPEFQRQHEMPDVLPETIFSATSNTEEAAKKLGYFLIHPAIGNFRDLNYRPALYGRGELANQIAAASEKLTSAEHQSAVINALYKVSTTSKRYIMYNPVYHSLNVAGRAIAFVMQDPTVAKSAFQAVHDLHDDPAAYHDLVEEASMAGLVHATQWNVARQLRLLQREEDGQHGFLGAVRTPIRALDNIHAQYAERGLWSAVDQLQLAGYLYSKQRFLSKGIRELEARQLAAVYANNLGGMVNPMYMSRLWRQLKGMVFFAPSYWSTFLHSLQSVVPGATRLSRAMTHLAGGRYIGLTAVPLRAIDYRSRIELIRAQRDWMITYLATTAVAMDMMNVMFSGHHLWENEQGHEWNIDVTNLPLLGGTQTTPSGEVKRSYITAAPFFRQGVDIGNAIGLGHDWGFAHTFGDQTWQQQDALHKAELLAGALIDGTRRAGATKIGQVPQVAYGLATGEEATSRLGEGTQVKIDRPAALLSLAPEGYQAQRLWKAYQQGFFQYQPGTPEYQQAQQQFMQQAQGLLPGAIFGNLGFPSVYHMGVERPPIDDSKFENWVSQRDASHSRLTADSASVFQGKMTPLEYARHKHEEQIRINQLNTDTWGNSSPGASLSGSYTSLATQFGLDDPSLSDQDWFVRYDAFLPAWEQLLQSAAPSTRAAWWDHSTVQWTDADYLEWEARQLRDSLAASVDGQGGNYIRAFQNQLFRLKPTLTVAEYTSVEQSDPYYSAYQTLLKEMGRTSPLGAFVSAFSSPYSQTYIPPAGLTTDEAQQLAEHTGQVVVRPEEAQALATQAKQIASEPEVAQAGGQPEASPEFQQQEQAALSAAESGVPEGQ